MFGASSVHLEMEKVGANFIVLLVSLLLKTVLPEVATTIDDVEEVVVSMLASSAARALAPILIFSAHAQVLRIKNVRKIFVAN